MFNFLLISQLVQALVASQGQESFFCFRISVGDFKDSLSVSTKNMKMLLVPVFLGQFDITHEFGEVLC